MEVELGPARLEAPHLPPGPAGGPFVAAPVPGVGWPGTAVSMGNPHLVLLDAPPEVVREHGPRLEHLPGFPERTNVEAVTRSKDGLRVSVWERGAGPDRRLRHRCRRGGGGGGRWPDWVPADAFVPVDLPGGRLAVRVSRGSPAHHLARPGALRLQRRAAGGAARLTAPLAALPSAGRPVLLWVVDARADARSWLGRAAGRGRARGGLGRRPGASSRGRRARRRCWSSARTRTPPRSSRSAASVRTCRWWPGWTRAVAVPRLTAPFEWASSADGGALLAAVERTVPWVNLRRERDAARGEAAAARRQAELHRRASGLLRDADAEGFHELLARRAAPRRRRRLGRALARGRHRHAGVLRATAGESPARRLPRDPGPGRSGAGARVRGPALERRRPGALGPAVRPRRGARAGAALGRGGRASRPRRWRRWPRVAGAGAAALLAARRFRALQRLALRDPDSSAYNLAYFTDVRDEGARQGAALRPRLLAPRLRPRWAAAPARPRRHRAGPGGGAGHHPGAGARAARLGRAGQGGRAGVPAPPPRDRPLRRAGLPPPGPGRGAGGAGAPGHRRARAAAAHGWSGELSARRRGPGLPHRGLPGAAGAASCLAAPSAGARAARVLGGRRAAARLARRPAAARRTRARTPRGAGACPRRCSTRCRRRSAGRSCASRACGAWSTSARAEAGHGLPLVRALERAAQDFAPRVYLLARRAEVTPRPGLTPLVLGGDERLLRHQFVLWLHGSTAYALLAAARPGRDLGLPLVRRRAGGRTRLQAAERVRPAALLSTRP